MTKKTKETKKVEVKDEQVAPLAPADMVLTNNRESLEITLSTILTKASPRVRRDLATMLLRTAAGASFGDACIGLEINWGTVQCYKKWHPAFWELWEASRQCGADVRQERREAEADRRAMVGWEEPVFQGGVQVGARRLYSDKLLEVQMRANAPKKYNSPPATNLQVNSVQQVVIMHRQMTPEAIAAQEARDAKSREIDVSSTPPVENAKE